ncbi:hypothetical protein ACQRCY_04945 [Acidaminococcus fermentans]|uniref:hypothetical protein n=1 Tax=Acidaminococcus fermentans TaxID=905 RepID=UPI003D00169E
MMRKHWNPMIGAAIALSLGVLPAAVAGAAPSREEAAALRNVRERQSDASMLQNEARNRARAEAQRAAAATGQIAVEETERPKLDLPDTLKVQVNGFKITGQDVIPEPELQALLADKKRPAAYLQRPPGGSRHSDPVLPGQKVSGGSRLSAGTENQ